MKAILKKIWQFIEDYFATRYELVILPEVAKTTEEKIISKYLWTTPDEARHSVRLICDEEGLSITDKNIITAVIHAESGFYNTSKNENLRADGSLSSTDWGICQINDRYHIGAGLDFPSVEFVVDNPDKAVRWMCRMYKAGLIKLWCAYQNKSYLKYL